MKKVIAVTMVMLLVVGTVAAYAGSQCSSSSGTKKGGWQSAYDMFADMGATDYSAKEKTTAPEREKPKKPEKGTEVSCK